MRTVAIATAMVMLFSGLYTAGLALRSRRRASVERLRDVLTQGDDLGDAKEQSALAKLWVELSRAAEDVSSQAGWGSRLDLLLGRAEISLSSGEFLVGLVGAAFSTALLLGLLTTWLTGLMGLLIAPLTIFLHVQRRAGKLVDRLEAQLPDALHQLASSMRSGYSLAQAIEAASEVIPAPLGRELSRTIGETRVGRSLEEALSATAQRVGSTDLTWSVKAMQIQARTGGAVADILTTLGDFMREREEVRREIRVLTADGRISAIFLLGIPVLVTVAILLTRPGYLEPLFTTSLGRVMIAGAVVSMFLGTLAIHKLVKVEV